MREYLVDVSNAESWPDFIAAFNVGFICQFGVEWKGNLDSFNDYLYWPDEHPYRLVIRGWSVCAPKVNRHLAPDSRPVLDVLAEIFRENPQVDVVLA